MKTNKRENVTKRDYSTIPPSIENFSKMSTEKLPCELSNMQRLIYCDSNSVSG